MLPDEVDTEEKTAPDDVFAQAFAQLSKAAAGDAPEPVRPDPMSPAARSEAERSLSEAQRDSAAFGPSGDGGGSTEAATSPGTTGPSGASGATGDGLPPDDKAKAEAEAARVAAEAARQPAINDADLVKRLAGLIKSAPVEEPQQQRQQEAFDPLSMFTPDEKRFLAEYEKEYPDIAKAEFMRRRVEYAQLTQWMFAQINAALQPKLEQYDSLLVRTHAGDLQAQVPVYNNEVRDKVIEWASKQPAYKRVAYEYVIRQGTVDEVADLIADWSKSTGYAPPATQAQGASDPVKAAEDARKAAAAAKLAPVKSANAQRAVSAVAPSDFDGAFDWATRALANI